jgi:tricorn protease
MKFKIFVLLFIIFGFFLLNAEESRLLRFPNSSKTEVTFVYGGDLYVAPITGGTARRITTSEGLELFPRFSPDGKTIAFTAQYDGNNDIYTIPSMGGTPKRITYNYVEPGVAERQGPDKIIMQWTADGSRILFRSRHESWNILVGQLFYVGKDGGNIEKLPIPRGGFTSLNPDGTKLAYNRIFREFRTWKRYSGGQADDISIYDLKTGAVENITNNKFQDIIPMWAGNKIYYLSDRDFSMNLFCYDLTTKQTKKITDFKEFDVKFPSLGANHIAFENGGYIYLMDLATEQITKLSIEIKEDFPQLRPIVSKVKDRIGNFDISPNAKRAVFSARGDIFNVPAENGNILNLTKTPGVHDREPNWSPDGKWIAYISDKSGNDEIYIMKPDGNDEVQLTSNGNFYRYSVKWSPDSKKLISSDNTRNLYYIDIVTKKQTNIAKSKYWSITDYEWSPDNKWIAYTNYKDERTGQVTLYSLEKNTSYPVTDGFYSSYSPEFTPGGKYLIFISDRTFNASFGNFEFNYQYNNMSNIYAVTLQDTTIQPFAVYLNDQETVVDEKEKDKSEKKEKVVKEKEEDKTIRIDLNGITSRIFEFPLPASNYSGLTAITNHKLYYVRTQTGQKPKLFFYDFVAREEKEVGDFSQYVISSDEKSILFRSSNDFYITKLAEKITPKEGKLNLDKMEVTLDRKAEWNQVFNESWRHFRDFFYDPNMHGYDWNALRQRYSQLLPYVVHRFDLTYIIGEMIGELDVGHAYVTGGEMPHVENFPIASLGADYELDKSSGFYKITKILQGMNWEDALRSPLTEPGLNIKTGEYIIKIDGVQLTGELTPNTQLLNKVNKFVTLTVNNKPSLDGAREVNVKTINADNNLRYYDWVENNRRKVDSATNGKIGYIHIPDMGAGNGLNWFVRYFYPQLDKEGLIIDDRYNGGGNVSPMIIERLRRELVIAKYGRNQEAITSNPGAVMTGPMVCLINEQSMSDGDLFPFQFHTLGLGPVIGKRSWGGVVGIYGSLPLLDGSSVNKPEVANFGADGKWILEDVGMTPDIEVDNEPYKEYNGIDQQLNKGIEQILELVKTDNKPKLPKVPPFQDKKGTFGK